MVIFRPEEMGANGSDASVVRLFGITPKMRLSSTCFSSASCARPAMQSKPAMIDTLTDSIALLIHYEALRLHGLRGDSGFPFIENRRRRGGADARTSDTVNFQDLIDGPQPTGGLHAD